MKISIITVCYQAGKTLEQTILSVLAQNYQHIEYIVIDGASSDNTDEILKRYESRIDLIISEKDKGIYDAMNKGIQKATGEVLGFLNADDLFSCSTVVSDIAETFRSQPAISGCYADLIYFRNTERGDKITRYFKSSPFQSGLFAKGWCLPHPTFYVKRSVYQKFGGFDLSYHIGNDVELMMRFLEKGKIPVHYVPKVWVKMRMGGVSNQSATNIVAQNKNILKAAKNLGVHINPIWFTLHKCWDRAWQYIRRPQYKVLG